MPWCDSCSKFWNPPSMEADGKCPDCGAQIAEPEKRRKGAPWHFKLMIVGVTVYMIYRIYWLIEWLPKHI